MITSASNPKLQLVTSLIRYKKSRDEQNLFVAEGVRLVEDAHHRTILPEFVLYTQSLSDRGRALVDSLSHHGVPVYDVAETVFKPGVDTEHSQGIVGVFTRDLMTFPEKPTFLLLVDGVRDPGNMGTLMRSALAAGVEGVITTEGTVDVFSPKVVRAGMGAHFSLPVWQTSWQEVNLRFLPSKTDVAFFVTVVADGAEFWSQSYQQPCVIVVGGEAEGVSSQALCRADTRITIPMARNTESLNASTAGTLVLYEVFRQRTLQPGNHSY